MNRILKVKINKMRIFTIIQKNLKVLIRSKTSALIVILGPMLIISLAGLAFNNMSSYQVKVGVFSSNYNELTNSFIEALEDRQYTITKYETTELCTNSIKQGDTHACIIFPDDFRIENQVSNEITFYVDYSKTNLVYMILESVSETIGSRSEELSLEMTSRILDALQNTKSTIIEKRLITQEAIEDIDSLEGKISKMELSTPSLNINPIYSNYQGISFHLRRIQNHTIELTDKAYELIVLVGNENLTSSIKTKVNSLNSSINSRTNNAFVELSDLNSTLVSLSRSFENLEKSLDDARIIKTDSLKLISNIETNLGTIKSSLDSIISNIEDIEVTELGTIVSPITTNIQPVVPERTYLNYLFPSLIILLIMMLCIMLSSNLVIMEKTSRAYFRNFTTPTSDMIFIWANYLTTFMIALMQVSLVLIIAGFIFKTSLLMGLALASITIFLSISLFSFIGLIIGHLYNSEETASIASISIASLFLLLSNLILPIESMPPTIINIAQYNPFVIASELLKQAVLFNTPMSSVYSSILFLVAYCFVIFIGLILIQQLSKIRFFKSIKTKKEATAEPVLNPEPKTNTSFQKDP